MAFKLAELFVSIGANTNGLQSGLAGVRQQLTGLSQQLSGFGGGGGGLMKGLGDAVTGGGAAGSLGPIAAMTVALVIGAKHCVEAWASLNEAVSKTEQIFGSASNVVIGKADEMAKKFGLSKRAALDAAGGFGEIIQGAGVGADKASEFSAELIKLAGDASRFNDVSFDEALIKLRAGLSGEMEPLRAWGPLLSEANVKAKAYAMGLKAGTGELTQQQKMLARIAIMQEGLAHTSGTLERESGNWGAQIERLAGGFENLTAMMGEKFEPLFVGTLKNINWIVETIGANFDKWGWARGHLRPFADPVQSARGYRRDRRGAHEEARRRGPPQRQVASPAPGR